MMMNRDVTENEFAVSDDREEDVTLRVPSGTFLYAAKEGVVFCFVVGSLLPQEMCRPPHESPFLAAFCLFDGNCSTSWNNAKVSSSRTT
jgi:hypothetical protein